jgi:hypothetical protein
MKRLIFLLFPLTSCAQPGNNAEQVEAPIASSEVPAAVTPAPPASPTQSGESNEVNQGLFSYVQYGAKGDGKTDDTNAIQACWSAAVAANGKVLIETPSVGYVITKPIVVKPSKGIQTWVSAEAFGANTNQHIYRGPSNSQVFLILGLKSAKWSGINVSLENQTDVAIFDITASPEMTSSSDVLFEDMRLGLGGERTYGVRFGWNESGPADISIYNFINIRVHGSKKSGQIGFLNVGSNTLANNWYGCFVHHCDEAVSNVLYKDGKKYRGNGAMYFFGFHTSQNNVVFHFDFENTYVVYGGRFELDNQILKTEDGRHNLNISFTGCQMSNVGGAVPFEMKTAGSISIEDCRVFRAGNDAGFDDLVRVQIPAFASKGVARVNISGGATIARNIITNVNGQQIYKSVKGLGRFTNAKGVYVESFYPDM